MLSHLTLKKKEIFEEEIEGAEEKAEVEGGKPEVPKGMTQRCKTIGLPLLQKFDECDSTDEPWYFTGFTAGTFVCLFVCLFTTYHIISLYDRIKSFPNMLTSSDSFAASSSPASSASPASFFSPSPAAAAAASVLKVLWSASSPTPLCVRVRVCVTSSLYGQ